MLLDISSNERKTYVHTKSHAWTDVRNSFIHNYHGLIAAKVLLRRQMMGHLTVSHLNYSTVKINELSNQDQRWLESQMPC